MPYWPGLVTQWGVCVTFFQTYETFTRLFVQVVGFSLLKSLVENSM